MLSISAWKFILTHSVTGKTFETWILLKEVDGIRRGSSSSECRTGRKRTAAVAYKITEVGIYGGEDGILFLLGGSKRGGACALSGISRAYQGKDVGSRLEVLRTIAPG